MKKLNNGVEMPFLQARRLLDLQAKTYSLAQAVLPAAAQAKTEEAPSASPKPSTQHWSFGVVAGLFVAGTLALYAFRQFPRRLRK